VPRPRPASHLSGAGAGAAHPAPASAAPTPQTPRTAPSARPETAPREFHKRDGSFRWEGLHNDLPSLLKAQAINNAIALVVFNHGFAPIALNCIVSLVRFGKAHNYIVAAVGDASVAHCTELRLPCYNATRVVKHKDFKMEHSTEGDAGRNTQEWFNLVGDGECWAHTHAHVGVCVRVCVCVSCTSMCVCWGRKGEAMRSGGRALP
jgi:hypothetical protein